MHMQMVHLLTAVRTGIEQRLITTGFCTVRIDCISTSMRLRELRCKQQHFTQQYGMLVRAIGKRFHMLFWDNQQMHRCSRIDVMKRYQIVILINKFRWDLFGDDLAKNAGCHDANHARSVTLCARAGETEEAKEAQETKEAEGVFLRLFCFFCVLCFACAVLRMTALDSFPRSVSYPTAR